MNSWRREPCGNARKSDDAADRASHCKLNSSALPRRGIQGAPALACQLGRGTAHDACRIRGCIEDRRGSDAGARKRRRRYRNVAPRLTTRDLGIAIHHAGGRRESKRSLQPRTWIDDSRVSRLRHGRPGCGNQCHSQKGLADFHGCLALAATW
jgi:hypothetical protein